MVKRASSKTILIIKIKETRGCRGAWTREANDAEAFEGGSKLMQRLMPSVFVGHLILSSTPKEWTWLNEHQCFKEGLEMN
jgi:hypothetical protein